MLDLSKVKDKLLQFIMSLRKKYNTYTDLLSSGDGMFSPLTG